MSAKKPGQEKSETPRGRRPFVLTMILWVYLLWILLGWLRFAGALRSQDLILSLVPGQLQVYLIAAGLTWGLAGLPVVWGLLARAAWAPVVIYITSVLYPGIYWFERLFLWRDPNAARNWPFMLLLTLLWLGLTFGVLQLRKVRWFFKDDDVERR